MRRIGRFTVATEVRENPLNDCRRLDARDDAQPPAALPAGLDVDGEYALEALGQDIPWCRSMAAASLRSATAPALGAICARSGLAGANTP